MMPSTIGAKERECRRLSWRKWHHVGVRGSVGIFAIGLAATLVLVCPRIARAQSINGTVALGSQLVDRGVAITPVTPTLQGSLSWTSPAGWSFSAAGSTELRSSADSSELQVQGARYWVLSSNWQMQASLLYYDYPGNARASAFNRAETGVDWIYRDVLTLGLSAVYLTGQGNNHQPRGAADLNVHWPLAPHLSFSAGVGAAQSFLGSYSVEYGRYNHDSGRLYEYGQVGLVWTSGPWRVELDRIAIDPAMRRRWAGLAAAPWVATIAWSF